MALIPKYQAVGTAVSATTGTLTVAWPTHAVGDIALLFVETQGGGTATLSTANGFVEVTNSPQTTGSAGTGTKLSVYWCRATTTAMSSPIMSAGSNHQYGVILTYRGCVTSGDPYDVTAGSIKAAATTSATVTAVVTTVPDNLIVQAITKDLDSTAAFASAQTNANLVAIRERFDAGTISGNGGGIAVWDGLKLTAGSTGTTSVTVTSSINAFMTISLMGDTSSTLLTGLTSYYELDESSGNAADSYSANTLTNNNTVTYGTGKINNGGIMVSASKQNLSITNFVGASTNGATFSAWVKYSALPSSTFNPGIVMAGGGSSPFVTHFLRLVNTAGVYTWAWARIKNGTGNSFAISSASVSPSTGTWYHVVGVTNGSTLAALYVDGVLVASTGVVDTASGSSGTNTDTSFRLGREYYTGDDLASRYIDATIDEVGIWARALSSSDVLTLYNSGTGLQYPFGISPTFNTEFFLFM